MPWRAGVLVVALLASGCTTQRSVSGGTPTTREPFGVTTTTLATSLVASHDFGTELSEAGRHVVGAGAARVDVGFYFGPSGASAAVFSFPAIGTSAECIRQAWLDIKFAQGNAGPGFGLVAYPARPETAARRDGSKIEGALLLDNRPRAEFTITRGAATANVTELVKTWLSGRGFPSQGSRVEPGRAVTIAVQPPSATSRETITIETSESGPPTAPTLRLHTSC